MAKLIRGTAFQLLLKAGMDTTALLSHTSRFPVFQNRNLGNLACLDIHYKERVAFRATHHLSMIQPLRSKHFIKGPKVKFSLLEETGKLLCRITM